MKLLFFFLWIPFAVFSQKVIYIPIDWQQGSLDYSFDRSAESENFIVFWGPLAGLDPIQAPAEIAFDQQAILNTAEDLYKFYIDTIQFLDDDAGLISQYKIILVMLHTWTGLEGWAFGGNYDGIVGAMWMHPHAASSGPTLAHEFTHTLQNYTWMMNPGHGFIDSSYVGFFWETHAEFMALQRYPSVALEFDMARWLNTSHFHWSSTRHHYQAFIFLQFIKEKDGISMINRLWNESIIGEHPLETYKRLKGITQDSLNNLFGEYSMRNVTWDYETGDLLRERISTINPVFISHQTIIPEIIDTVRNWYRIQNHLAPQDYGYNIIRLYPDSVTEECDKRVMYLNFKPQYIYPDYEEYGHRFGFVAVDGQNQARYSPMSNNYEEIAFEMLDNETELYLVVTGAPRNHHNYAWEIGFPKIYRYPYEFRLKGAVPEGFQKGFRSTEGIAGTVHPNGGGFVGENAVVAPTAYVGPHAQVLDGAIVSDNARIEDYAIVRHSATLDDNAVISGLAIVGESSHVYGNAVITEQAHVYGSSQVYDSAFIGGNALIFHTSVYENAMLTENTFAWGANLHGDIVLGGDAEFFTECSDGTYKQVEWAYDRNCDGLDDHQANTDITERFFPAPHYGYVSLVCDTLLDNIFYDYYEFICEGDTVIFYGDTITSSGIYEKIIDDPSGVDLIITLWIDHYIKPILVGNIEICKGDSIEIEGEYYSEEGWHPVTSYYGDSCVFHDSIRINFINTEINKELVLIGNTLWVQDPDPIYQWYDCATDTPIPGKIQSSFTPSSSGSYKVRFTTIEGCVEFSECYDVIIVGTDNPSVGPDINILPNPASDFVEVSFQKNYHDDLDFEIIDMLGKIYSAETLPKEENQFRINVANLFPGIYTVRIKDSAGRMWVKMFVKL